MMKKWEVWNKYLTWIKKKLKYDISRIFLRSNIKDYLLNWFLNLRPHALLSSLMTFVLILQSEGSSIMLKLS